MNAEQDPETDPLRAAAEVMRQVRERCVWSQAMTHRELVPYLVEESAELIDAVERDDRAELREELGDLLWQVLFHAAIAAQDPEDPFDIDDVARTLTEKMTRRHPHVFGDAIARTPEEVLVHWNAAKAAEKHERRSVLDGIPPGMPALARAQKILGRAAKAGVEVSEDPAVEVGEEALPAIVGPTPAPVAEPVPLTEAELGDQLLALVVTARTHGWDAERALRERIRLLEDEVRAVEGSEPAGRTWKNGSVATVNPPRGMRDFLPADKARRERVLSVIRERYRAHGFDEIETPVIEEYDRLHAGIGGDNEKLSFNILRRGLDADGIRAAAEDPAGLSDLGLRYDLTVPLARFYATNRGQLPGVFRSIQIGPVWRAERPQKGRYRQFVQCDIDIIGDDSARAEAELIVASLDTIDALGLTGGMVRVNDRRALDWMLDSFGFAEEERPGVLITIDKLDKIGADGIVAELRERGAAATAVDAFATFLHRPQTLEYNPYGERQIRKALPENAPEDLVAHLVGLGEAVAAARPAAEGIDPIPLQFDPFLVRGMGYYTGTIMELAHPSVSYSLGGGGRYDGMIGRFLGQQVPAVGFSIGFERIVDLLESADDAAGQSVVLVHDGDVPVSELVAHKAALIAGGARVRLERRTKNLKALLERAAADGYTAFAGVRAGDASDALEVKPLS